jgi:hypothetical protein
MDPGEELGGTERLDAEGRERGRQFRAFEIGQIREARLGWHCISHPWNNLARSPS